MTALLILIPVALLLGAVGLMAFLWSLRSGQFDDLDGAAVRILADDETDRVRVAERTRSPASRSLSGQQPAPPH